MIGKKLSDKFKIVAAVLAVIVVAAAAIAFNALVTDSDGSQSGLYAAGDTETARVVKAVDDVSINTTGTNSIAWTNGDSGGELIGRYKEYSTVSSTVTVPEGLTVDSIDVEGTTLYGNASIDSSYIQVDEEELSITLTQAGNYIATVTLSDNRQAVFCAQVGRAQLDDVNFKREYDAEGDEIVTRRLYNGESFEAYMQVGGSVLDHNVLEITSVNGIYHGSDVAIEETDIEIIEGEYDDYFTVVNAGVYSATVTIRNEARCNYEWKEHPQEYASTATGFTVEQAPIKGVFNYKREMLQNTGDFEFEYVPNMSKSTLTNYYGFEFSPTTLDNKDATCGIVIEIYNKKNCNAGDEVTDYVVSTKSYYAKAIDVVSSSGDSSDNSYRNYRIVTEQDKRDGIATITDLNALVREIKIVACQLTSPSFKTTYFDNIDFFVANDDEYEKPVIEGKTISALYKAYDYYWWQFFSANDWNVTYEKGAYWKVTVNGEVIDNLETYSMRNVGSYKICIEPANSNYVWSEDSSPECTLTIRPYTLRQKYVEWPNNNFVYRGEEISLDEIEYSFKSEFISEDDVSFKFVLDETEVSRIPVHTTDAEGNAVITYRAAILNAGGYSLYVVDLEGNDKSNYALPADNSSNYPNGYGFEHQFTVYRKKLADLSGTTVVNGTFNGDSQTFDIGQLMLEYGYVIHNGNNLTNLAFCSITRDGMDANNEASVLLNNSFTATAAGVYSLTLSISTAFATNYCFADGDPTPEVKPGTYEWENFAVIERAEIDPSLSQSMFSIDDNYVNLTAGKDGTVNGGTTAVYSIGFGTVGSDIVKSAQNEVDFDADTRKFAEGHYYILYTLTDDAASSCYFTVPSDNSNYEILADGKQAKVYYAVSSNAASVTFNVGSYVFGDNLIANGTKLDDVVKMGATNMTGFIGDTTVKFYFDNQRQNEVTSLVNGLPRNAGTYYLHIEVTFTNDTAAWTSDSYTLTVSKRPVNVSWTVDDEAQTSLPYNGSEHTVAATNNTLAGVPNVDLTVVGTVSVTNAGSYDYTVALDGDEKDNYTLTDGVNVNFTLTVTGIQITISAPSIGNITFGNPLDEDLLAAEGIEEFLSDDYHNEISVYVYASNGNRVTNLTNLSKDTYTLVPVWGDAPASKPTLSNGRYVTTQGNYEITMQTTTFAVVSKQITVTLKDDLSSQYGDPLNVSGVVQNVEGLPDGAKTEDYLTIVGTNKSTGVALSATAPAGFYTIRVQLVNPDGDYALANPDDTVTYEITRRQVTITANNVESEYGEGYPVGSRIDYTVTKGSILESEYAAVKLKLVDVACNKQWKQVSNTSLVSMEGEYYHVIKISGVTLSISPSLNENGKYQYTIKTNLSTGDKTINNYEFTVIVGNFTIVTRTLTFTFTNDGTSEYGEEIDLFKQENESNKYFNVLTVDKLMNYTNTETPIIHQLNEVADLYLVDDDDNEVELDHANAGTYRIKVKLKNNAPATNYTIADGVKGDDGLEYVIGGTYTVTPRVLTATITPTTTSTTYGTVVENAGSYTIDKGTPVPGDDLGVTVVFLNSANEQIDISKQNVGDYSIGLVWTNNNYEITFNKKTIRVGIRGVTITPVAVTNHVYGNALAVDELGFTTDAVGFASEEDKIALGITAHVYTKKGATTTLVPDLDVATLVVGGDYVIKLTVANTNSNYKITNTATANFTVVQRPITIEAQDVAGHVYGDGWKNGDKFNELKYKVTSDLKIIDGDNLKIDLTLWDGDSDVTNNVATLSQGEYTIKVTASNSNYDITTVNATFTIGKLEAKITFKNDASHVYGETVSLKYLLDNDVVCEIEGLLDGDKENVVLSIVNADDPSINVTDLKAPAGKYMVIVTLGDNYDVKEYIDWEQYGDNQCGSYTIEKRKATLTASNVTNHVYGDALTEQFGATGDNFIDGDLPESITVKVYNGNTEVTDVTKLDVGQYVLKITDYTDNANYDITVKEGEFHVAQREITLTFTANGGTSVYGNYSNDDLFDAAVGTLSNTVNGHTINDLVTLTLTKGGVAVNDANPSVDEYGVTAQLTDGYSNNYTLKAVGTGKYAITARTIELNADVNLSQLTYGDNLPSNSLGYKVIDGSFVNTDDEQNLNLTAKVLKDGVDVTNSINEQVAGTYTVTYVYTQNNNYTININTATFNIVQRAVTVTFSGGDSSTYGEQVNLYDQNVVDIATASGCLVNGHEFADVVILTATKDGIAMSAVKPVAGDYVVTAAISADYSDKYAINLVSPTEGSYEIYQRTVNIIIADITDHIYGNAIGTKLTDSNAYSIELGDPNYTGSAIVEGDELNLTLGVYLSAEDTTAVADVSKLGKGEYVIKATYNDAMDANYNVFIHNAQYADAQFIVSARNISVTFDNGKHSFYGDTVEQSVLSTLYTVGSLGLVNDDTISVSAVLNGTSVTASKAPAGAYTVTITVIDNVTGEESDNYAINYANGESGTYTVDKRVITVSLTTDTLDFEPTVEGTNNGAERNVTPEFTNNVDEVSYNLSYAIKDGEALAGAPTNAGVYNVTVVLTDDNYVLAGDTTTAEFVFTVNKLVIDVSAFAWDEHIIQYVDYQSNTNTVAAYNANLMEVVLFTKTLASAEKDPKPVYQQGHSLADKDNYYYFENNKLLVHASGRARYEVTINLTAEASVNYEFSQEGNVVIAFHIVSLSVEVTALANGWQYTDTPTPSNFTILVNGQDPMYGLKYYIVEFIGSDTDWNDLMQLRNQADFKGFAVEQMEGKFGAIDESKKIDFDDDDAFATLKNSDVGRYVLYVSYDGVIQDEKGEADFTHLQKFDIFEVSKKVLTAPTFADATYNGTTQSLTVNYDNQINGVSLDDIVIAIYKGSLVNSGGSISEKNVGKYNITFSINANYTDRYCWEQNSIDDKVVSWTITQDKAENTDNKYFSVTEITVTYGDTVTTIDPTPIDGYEGTFTWEFATRRNETVPASGWVEDMPTYAGYFWIRITLTDNSGRNNFTAKVAYGKLTINKATLTLIPSGTLTYGEPFDQEKCRYDFDASGYKNGDTSVSVSGNITYKLVETSLNGNKLNANLTGYALTAVSTLTTNNYTIVVAEGKLIVNKLAVTVTIGDATSQYGLAMNLSVVKATSDNTLATNEVVAEVEKNLSIEEDLTSYVVGTYNIVSSYTNDNFEISYNKGTYTVTAREVSVTLDNTNAGGTYGGTINPVTFTVVDDGNGLAELVKSEFTITVVYNGTAYDVSKDYTNSVDAPEYAGNSYTATAIGDSNNANFILTAPTPISLEVKKIVVDSSKISTESQMYTGEGLDPSIVDKDYNVNGASIYTVNYDKNDLVDVKTHDLELALVDVYNYAWNSLDNASSTVTIKFVIAGAGIYAIPYAADVVYGATYNDVMLALNYKLVYASGINKGQDAKADVRVTGGVKYVFVDKDAQSLNLDRLASGTYRISLETVNGFVVGLESTNPNYSNIALELDDNKQIVYGALEVKPCQITITVNNSNSVYSQAIDVSNNGFKITEGNLVFDDTTSVIDFRITAVTSDWINADDYDVTATATADNYEVTVNKGTHTIEQIKVTVSYEVTDGIYLDKEATVTPSFTATNLDGYEFPANFETKLVRKITGSKDYDSSAIPTNAGIYSVTATGITDDNYLFVSSATETFTVAKKTVDETVITVQSKEYNGLAQSHDVAAVQGVYTVSNDVYTDVDTYDVELTLVDPDNYAWTNETSAVVTKKFTITPATLTITPSGSIVYGDAFSDSACNYEPEGFKGNDTRDILSGSVTYSLENAPDKLTVKKAGYTLVVNVQNLTASNYVIKTVKGVFMVEKRELSIKPVDTTSVYTQKVVLSDTFELAKGSQFVLGDDKSAIKNYAVTTSAYGWVNAGNYKVEATASADNYIVEVLPGQHTISPIAVGVLMHAIGGVYGDKANAGSIEYLSIVATNLDGQPDITEDLQFVLQFSGNGYDGTPASSSTMPTHAGLYRVRVASIYDTNYAIDRAYGISETMIEIAKKEIDARDIKAVSESYTGALIRPVITGIDDNVCSVSYDSAHVNGFVDAGSYDVRLTLNDVNNYCWKDNRNSYTTIKFEVVKADNAIVDDHGEVSATAKVEISGWTIDGVASKPSAKLLNGSANDVIFEYSTSKNGGFSAEVPSNAGTYWVRAVVAASANFNAFVSEPVSFEISKRVVKMPAVVNNGASVYSGEMLSLDIVNYDDRVMRLSCDLFTKSSNNTLTLSALNAGTYTARLILRDASNYEWEDQSQLVDGAVVVTWTIQRKVLSVLQAGSNKMYVNGEDIVFIPEGYNSGIMTIRDNVRAHEGHYSAVITLKDKANYAWEGIDGDTITVEFELSGTNTVFVAIICVVAGLCVGLAVMAVILTLVNRNKKRKQAAEMDRRSQADGWDE